MCRRSSRRWMVMPSAPPSRASTAAATGSGSMVRRAWRTVATWSMLTPSRIIAVALPITGSLEVRADLAVAGCLAAEDFVQEEGEDQRHELIQGRSDNRDAGNHHPGQHHAAEQERRIDLGLPGHVEETIPAIEEHAQHRAEFGKNIHDQPG